tara:strand:- start:945 stop:1454 length:510 start_codon:yes stop_codon:yes gene_type:complete
MKRGFTLVELMVVVLVMGVILGISIPTFRSILKKAPLEQAISDVEAACRNARAKAIIDNREMEVYFNEIEDIVALSTSTRAVMTTDSVLGFEGRQIESGEEVERISLEADLEILSPRDDDFPGELTLKFYSNGTAEPVQLRVSGETGAYLLNVDPVTGHTTVVNEEYQE